MISAVKIIPPSSYFCRSTCLEDKPVSLLVIHRRRPKAKRPEDLQLRCQALKWTYLITPKTAPPCCFVMAKSCKICSTVHRATSSFIRYRWYSFFQGMNWNVKHKSPPFTPEHQKRGFSGNKLTNVMSKEDPNFNKSL